MAKNDSIRLPHGKTPQILVFQTKWTAIESNYGPSFIHAHIVKCIGLKGLKMPPPKKSKIDSLDKNDSKMVKN